MNCLRFSVLALSLTAICTSTSAVFAGCAQPAKMAYSQAVTTQKFIDIGQKTNQDPIDLFRCAAEKETDPALKGKYYNGLASAFEKRGKTEAALMAYEQAALSGNQSAGSKVFKAQESGAYKPRAMVLIAQVIYVPKALTKNGSRFALLLAKLVDSGQLKGPEFKTSSYWMQKAARGGSKSAIRSMAETASIRGDIKNAAAYFRMVDKKPANIRALREARNYFLGKGSQKNPRVGMAWLAYGSTLSPVPSAKLAARFFRLTKGVVYSDELKRIAAAGGIPNLQIGSGGNAIIMAAYAAAKTDAEKTKVLASLFALSKSGNGTADFSLARILETDGGFANFTPAEFYISALEKNNIIALPKVGSLLAVLDPSDLRVKRVVGVLSRTAQSGNHEAQKILGVLYIVGGPVKIDYAKGTGWLKQASDAGDVEAKYRLGVLLVLNNRDGADLNIGTKYLQSAAAAGNKAAKKFVEDLSITSP